MGFVRVENYDGIKGYIDEQRFVIRELGATKYLLIEGDDLIQIDGSLEPLPFGQEHSVYRIIIENRQNSTAKAIRIKSKKALTDLAKLIEEDDEKLLKEIEKEQGIRIR